MNASVISFSDQISFYTLVAAVLIGLLGSRIWTWVDRYNKDKRIRALMFDNLQHLKENLVRIRDDRNSTSGDKNERVYFDSTSISEIGGYEYLYKSLFLNNVNDIDISRYPDTVKFFRHYLINLETIRSRVGMKEYEKTGEHYGISPLDVSHLEGCAHLKYGSIDNLLNNLELALTELRK